MEYEPDKWLGVKIGNDHSPPHYRIFASWYGGYLGGDSWKLNSGITNVTLKDDIYSFEGSSGSVYLCHKNNYGASGYGSGVLKGMIEGMAENGIIIEILPEDTDWLSLDYNEH